MVVHTSIILAVCSFLLSGCALNLSSQPRRDWETGFWYWYDYSKPVQLASEPVDVIFVHVGSIEKPNRQQGWRAFSNIPVDLPKARHYWLVFRFEHQSVPDLEAVQSLGDQLADLAAGATRRGLPIAGVQLDIDSPTRSLPQYAKFLHELRKELPSGWKLSVTGLLDWFRSGTAVEDVVRETDQFVPQFYDTAPNGPDSAAVGTKIDAAKWGPVFNRFRKPFRIGISSFGRGINGRGFSDGMFGDDLKITDVAMNAAFQMTAEHNVARELTLTYRATRNTKIGYNTFSAGDSVKFILATPESVHDAVTAARQMGGQVAGVVFFRWPGQRESSTMDPDEVLAAAGVRPPTHSKYEIEALNAHCATVSCVDLYLKGVKAFSANATQHRITSSVPLEYFLPDRGMPIHMDGTSSLNLALPPYCERGRLYLGRAVTASPSNYSVEER